MNVYVHNKTSEEKVYAGQSLPANSFYKIPDNLIIEFRNDASLLSDIANSYCCISNDGTTDLISISDQIGTLNGSIVSSKIVESIDPHPFALPLYRTKRMKTGSIETVAPGTTKEIVFQLPAELYTNGGCMIVENALLGDYIYAEVEDIDSLIPAPYRAALCEAWPVVGQYIIGEWVEVQGQYSVHRINTAPLIAKITPGLYLSLHYVAISGGSDRKVGINYYMNKKL